MEVQNLECEHSTSLKEGFISALPIVIGYIPVAMAFGLLAKSMNVSFKDNFLFSSVVFAGSSQFLALGLIQAGISAGSIILSVFLLNLRHFMMSAALSMRLKGIKRKWLFLIAFGVTDESFSVASLNNKKLTLPFILALEGMAYASWVGGTVLGYLVGSILPESVQSSLGVALYAMFLSILIPEMKKSLNVVFLSILSGIIYVVISYFNIVPEAWSIITTIILASALGVMIFKDEEQSKDENLSSHKELIEDETKEATI